MDLSLQQRESLERGDAIPLSEAGIACVLVRADVFARLKYLVYDDSPLSADEKTRLLIEAGKRAGWDDPEMDVYNDLVP